jgi:arylamine N-acetyltransferase
MAKTYYKFAERSAESQINWAEVGKNVTDMLNTEASIREEKKAAIDEASRQYGETLANAPTGDFKAASEWTLDFANDAAQARLMQDRLLKSGRLSVRDYTVQRQNLGDSTKQMFEVSKEYQDKAKELMERYELGQSQETEAWLMEQIEGLSNFTNTKAYINPTNGQVSIAKMVKESWS